MTIRDNLIWNNSGYYIVGYSQNHDKIIKFRVDRIAAPYILDKPAVPKPSNFNIAVYSKSVFSMYDDSAPQTIKLKCENSLMKTIVDRFGKDVDTSILDDTHFTAGVPVAVSPAFYGWVFSFAGKMCIRAPEDVRDEYALLASIAAKKT